MKKIALLVMCLVGSDLYAQIEIISAHAYRAYLQYEPIEFITELRSKSGQPLVVNSQGGPRFYFVVRDEHGHEISPVAAAEPLSPVMMAAQGAVVFTNYLNRIYSMAEAGQYTIQPAVDWNGKSYAGEKRHIEIVRGREITRLSAAIPADGSSRNYVVYHINRGQQDHLLLRIDDENAGVTYGVYSLGRSVMNEKPQMAVDAAGHAHILFQSAPRTYTHAVYSPLGSMTESSIFGRDYRVVSLQSQPNGSIKAVGAKNDDQQPDIIESIIEGRKE